MDYVDSGITLKLGTTEAELAKRIGRDQARISEIERSERNITSSMIDELCKVFGVNQLEMLSMKHLE